MLTTEAPSDRALFERWKAGDIQAASELFERHIEAIERFFRNKVIESYEDLVQQTFVACLEGQHRFRGESSFRSYLFGIANNTLRRHFRTCARRRNWIEPIDEMSAAALAPGPSTLDRRRREHELLTQALRRIPLDHQVVLELFYWEEMSAATIAEIVGTVENTVRNRLRRGRELLLQQLGTCARTPAEYDAVLADLLALEAEVGDAASGSKTPAANPA